MDFSDAQRSPVKRTTEDTIMSRQKYCALIDQLCDRFGIEHPKWLHFNCSLHVNDVVFNLSHGEEVDSDSLYIHCDFGEPPSGTKSLVMQRLMQTNLYLGDSNTPSFGFNAETGRALMMTRMALSETTLGSLIGVLINTAAYVHTWRENFYQESSDVEPLPAGESAMPVMH